MQWVEAARIGRRPNGEVFCAEILLQYSKPDRLDAAYLNIKELNNGGRRHQPE